MHRAGVVVRGFVVRDLGATLHKVAVAIQVAELPSRAAIASILQFHVVPDPSILINTFILVHEGSNVEARYLTTSQIFNRHRGIGSVPSR
jgi:hypothetical protein